MDFSVVCPRPPPISDSPQSAHCVTVHPSSGNPVAIDRWSESRCNPRKVPFRASSLTEALVGRNGNIARRGSKAAIQNFHKRGLSAAIGVNKAVAIATTKFDRDVFKQWLSSKLHSDSGGRDQLTSPESTRTVDARAQCCVSAVVFPNARRNGLALSGRGQ